VEKIRGRESNQREKKRGRWAEKKAPGKKGRQRVMKKGGGTLKKEKEKNARISTAYRQKQVGTEEGQA